MKKFLLALMSLCATQVFALSVTTYNAGIAHNFVPLAKERVPFITEALSQFDTDVLCLQEVWDKKDRKAVISALEKDYPFIHTVDLKKKRADKAPTCKIKQLFGDGKFVSCALSTCKGKEGDEYTDCILNKCGGPLQNLINEDRQCATALMSQVDKSSLGAIATVLNPLVRAPLFAYGGSNGLILLSKKKFAKTDYVDWTEDSTLNRRGALAATLESGETVYCTHLTANQTSIPYTGKFASWEAENLFQVEKLVEKALDHNEGAIVLGDFNISPSLPEFEIDGDFEANYSVFEQAGFDASVDYMTNTRCTFCADNTLIGGGKNMLLDHVFSVGLSPLSSKRVFDRKVIIEGKEQNLSDHFGIFANFEE